MHRMQLNAEQGQMVLNDYNYDYVYLSQSIIFKDQLMCLPINGGQDILYEGDYSIPDNNQQMNQGTEDSYYTESENLDITSTREKEEIQINNNQKSNKLQQKDYEQQNRSKSIRNGSEKGKEELIKTDISQDIISSIPENSQIVTENIGDNTQQIDDDCIVEDTCLQSKPLDITGSNQQIAEEVFTQQISSSNQQISDDIPFASNDISQPIQSQIIEEDVSSSISQQQKENKNKQKNQSQYASESIDDEIQEDSDNIPFEEEEIGTESRPISSDDINIYNK